MPRLALVAAALLALALPSPILLAHCDTMDGPVVAAAQKALRTGDVTPVLKWVRPADEKEIRDLFEKTRTVRQKGDDARELADRCFFETLVRVHRAGEGAPFIVTPQPGRESGPAAVGAGKGTTVGPFAQHGLDEALSLSVGLRRIGPGSDVPYAKDPQGFPE